MIRTRAMFLIAALASLLALRAAGASPIRIGVTLSATGPAASLGVPQRNSIALLPTEIAGQPVEWIVLDDASDAGRAVANARKLIEESNVDVLLGSSTTPNSLAMLEVAGEKHVPMISFGASARIVEPVEGARVWVFKTAPSDSLMAEGIAEHMAKAGIKTVGFIGFNDAYGDSWLKEATKALEARGIKLVATERFARADPSVMAQTLKLIAAKPDAMLIAASGTPAALPERTLKERGWSGPIYQTHGVASADFLRVGGKDVEGTIFPAGPVLVAEQLPADNPVRAVGLDYMHRYEAQNGPGSMATFGAHAWDAAILLQHAIPIALQTAQPGKPEFRQALRDALEGLHDVPLTHGVVTMSPTDHNGYGPSGRVMVTIRDGKWLLLP